jgi:methylated-DNA-[protein]-cysteine S-methyltransferase
MFAIETTYLKTPLGTAKIMGDKNGIQSISVLDENTISNHLMNAKTPFCLQECATQLEAYFNQKKVWKSLLKIPNGKTKSYLEQSITLGDVKAIRAVASAIGKNPLWIVIPCHRVIGSDGSLTGYAGGIWRKKWLLAHENPVKQHSLF